VPRLAASKTVVRYRFRSALQFFLAFFTASWVNWDRIGTGWTFLIRAASMNSCSWTTLEANSSLSLGIFMHLFVALSLLEGPTCRLRERVKAAVERFNERGRQSHRAIPISSVTGDSRLRSLSVGERSTSGGISGADATTDLLIISRVIASLFIIMTLDVCLLRTGIEPFLHLWQGVAAWALVRFVLACSSIVATIVGFSQMSKVGRQATCETLASGLGCQRSMGCCSSNCTKVSVNLAQILGFLVATFVPLVIASISAQPRECPVWARSGTGGFTAENGFNASTYIHWPQGLDPVDPTHRNAVTDSLVVNAVVIAGASLLGVLQAAALIFIGQAAVASLRRKEAEEATSMIRRAIAYVSHEARGPLNAAVLSLALLEAIEAEGGDQQQDDSELSRDALLSDLRTSVHASKRHLDDLLLWEQAGESQVGGTSNRWWWANPEELWFSDLQRSFRATCRAEKIEFLVGNELVHKADPVLETEVLPPGSPIIGPASPAAPRAATFASGGAFAAASPAVARRSDPRPPPGGAPTTSSKGSPPLHAESAPIPQSRTVISPPDGKPFSSSATVAMDKAREPMSSGGARPGPLGLFGSRMGWLENSLQRHESVASNPGEPVEVYEVFCDHDRLNGVLKNAVSNAIKHSKADGTAAIHVTATVFRGKSFYRLSRLGEPRQSPPTREDVPAGSSLPDGLRRRQVSAADSGGAPQQADQPPKVAVDLTQDEDERPRMRPMLGGDKERESLDLLSSQSSIPEKALLQIEVRDNGKGISEELMRADKLFRPFSRLRQGDDSLRMASSGLGLAIVRSIVVDGMGGSVGITSREGKGTVFFARVPVWVRKTLGGDRSGRSGSNRVVGIAAQPPPLPPPTHPLASRLPGEPAPPPKIPDDVPEEANEEDDELPEPASRVKEEKGAAPREKAKRTREDRQKRRNERKNQRKRQKESEAEEEEEEDDSPFPRVMRDRLAYVVDDERVNRSLLGALLRRWGFRVSQFSNGREVVDELTRQAQLLQERAPAADWPLFMTLDVEMPVLNGFGVLRERKALGKRAEDPAVSAAVLQLPIIVVTGNARREDREELDILGAATVLAKPVEPSQLIKAIIEKTSPGARVA
jgi:signal transduction histidine kinase/CheY-like chemotaxis protein